MARSILPGRSFPLGATVQRGGVNFSVFSKNCRKLELLLFDELSDKPAEIILLDPVRNKTFYYWHAFVPDILPGQLYGYRAYGPYAPESGHRFDPTKILLDPYTKAVAGAASYRRNDAASPGDNSESAMKSVVVDPSEYDWEGDLPLNHSFAKSVIYEMHVGGFTRHPNSGLPDSLRGTFSGVVEKIPYLKDMGVTSLELMPVQQFDPQDSINKNLSNYWGYSPVALFAPHSQYGTSDDPLKTVNEFRDMVKALHRAGIEVILDVVFNHTAEGDHNGPVISFKGLENRAYYLLEPNRAFYTDFSGTGNTLNANHSIVRRLILDCLNYWVSEMHIDGFRFDLASILSRDEKGNPMENPPILWDIESDPVLASTKIIAEAWDASGLYQLGSFVGHKWAEWNGRYRDVIRKFVRGDDGQVYDMAVCIAGSPDLFREARIRDPNRSINFVTSHDGFTINDLVSYDQKNNYLNGEENRDGTDQNYSWNHGIEGPTDNEAIERLRQRQIKNYFTLLMLSQGTPMLTMGDEVRRTQQGNNNAYNQDNEISWFDWSLIKKEQQLLRFVQMLVRFNLSQPFFQENYFWKHLGYFENPNSHTHVTWHGVELGSPDLSFTSHSFAYTLKNVHYPNQLHIMVNAYQEPLKFELPVLNLMKSQSWYRILDTSLKSPLDICHIQQAKEIELDFYLLPARSIAVLQSKTTESPATGDFDHF